MRQAVAALIAVAACGGPGEVHVSLAPVPTVGGCGKAPTARSMKVTALGDFPSSAESRGVDGPFDLTSFPPDTRQLAIEFLGPGGGETSPIGVSQPLVLGQLADGDVVPILVAPRDGFCQVGPLTTPRDRPLIARLGPGALVIGGQTAAGPILTAEYYDPATGAFTPIDIPPQNSAKGFVGATATRMPDGRVVVAGGASKNYSVYDPVTARWERPAPFEERAFHAAVAIDATHLASAAGCSTLTAAGACPSSSLLTTTSLLDVDSGLVVPGPSLGSARIGGTALLEATGDDLTGAPGVVLAGGTDLVGAGVDTVERFAPIQGGPAATVTSGAAGLVAPLAAGEVLVALGAGDVAAGGAAVVTPGKPPHAVTASTPRAGAVLVPLEDGSIAAIGGAATTAVDRYQPALRAWRPVAAGDGSDAPSGIAGAAAVRLDDGTVLVVGGHDAQHQPLASAWIYRPALGGSYSGVAATNPGIDERAPIDPIDPALVSTTGGDWEVRADGPALRSWAIVAGPAVASGTVTTTVRPSGGVALLLGFLDPAHFDAVVLAPGGVARLERHAPGAITGLCTGSPIPASLGDGTSVTLDLARDGDRVRARVTPAGGAAATVLDCAPVGAARGAVGIGPVGDGANLIVDTIAVSR